MPYCAVGDEAFPLKKHLMRPYPGRGDTEMEEDLQQARKLDNYRHCRARRMVEGAFGILAARWRVYHTKMNILPQTVKKTVLATTLLHNMLQRDTTPAPPGGPEFGTEEVPTLIPLRGLPRRGSSDAFEIRKSSLNIL